MLSDCPYSTSNPNMEKTREMGREMFSVEAFHLKSQRNKRESEIHVGLRKKFKKKHFFFFFFFPSFILIIVHAIQQN